jgi:hypothetical protein
MAESSWPTLEVSWEHLQNIISKGCMTAVELAICLVPAGPECPALAEGFIVVCAAFHEQDLVCHHIDSSSPTAWSCIIGLLQGFCIWQPS